MTSSHRARSRTAPSRRIVDGSMRTTRLTRTSDGRPLPSQPPAPTSTHKRPARRSCAASRSWSLLVSCIPSTHRPSRPTTSTGRSLPWLWSSSKGTCAQTTSPGSGSPSGSGCVGRVEGAVEVAGIAHAAMRSRLAATIRGRPARFGRARRESWETVPTPVPHPLEDLTDCVSPRPHRAAAARHAAGGDPQLLHHRPHRPRQVDPRRPHARDHRRRRRPRDARPVPRPHGHRARARHHDQEPSRADAVGERRCRRHARATTSST